jgi:XapX domain-containing protein
MKLIFLSLGSGLLVGIIYGLRQVRSPAPPAIVLLGLPGILIGEQIGPVVKQFGAGQALTMLWFKTECVLKITGAPSALTAKTHTENAIDVGKQES